MGNRIIESKNVEEFLETVTGELRGTVATQKMDVSIIKVAYICYLGKKTGLNMIADVEEFINHEITDVSIRNFVLDRVDFDWSLVNRLLGTISENELYDIIIYLGDESISVAQDDAITPKSIRKLALNLLDIRGSDKVADFGTGKGSFIIDAFHNSEASGFYGNEINTNAVSIAYLRGKLLNEIIEIKQEDMFSVDSKGMKFDKIFSNFPFGMRLRELSGGMEYLNRVSREFPDLSKATSSDWVFNSLIVKSLKEDGKAVSVMTTGSIWNSLDKKLREYFLRAGYIEAIIALPANLFAYTGISTVILVMSNGNRNVRMIDATELHEKGRRQNQITDNHITKILEGLRVDSEYARTVSFEDIKENDFNLSPMRYLGEEIKIENGMPFGNVIKRITRGAPLTASMLDDLISKEPTKNQYLMLNNIQEGLIDSDLPYLVNIDERYKKYCIENGNLLLSKNGHPFKVAVADIEEGLDILANGNLYVIELDETQVNPYYVKSFFESEKGIASLKSIAVGAAIPNISVEALKKLRIPLISLEEQDEIGEKYLTIIDEIKILNLRLDKAKSSLKHLLDMEEEG